MSAAGAGGGAGLQRASLQRRLLLLVLAAVVLVWLAAAAATWIDARHELDELLDAHLAQAAALLAARQLHELDDEAEARAAPLHPYAPRVTFQVFHEGRLVLRSANAPAESLRPPGADAAPGFATVAVDGVPWRVFAARGAEPDVQVYVGERVGARAAILNAVARGAAWPIGVALPLLALAVGWSVHRGLEPLRRLGRSLAARRASEVAPLAVDGGAAELEPMVDALNGLLARIGALLESERRFTADAAHELRTPIAAIRAQAQVALAEADAAARRHALEATIEGCDRATRVVEQLLALARIEADASPAFAAIELGVLARRVVAALAPRALAERQSIALDAEDGCRIDGDETLVGLLLRNLVDNALRYGGPGAPIEVRVGGDATTVWLEVEDGGPGLDEPGRKRLGERFYRAPGTSASGSGLGWSIVQRIAEVHGASVAASPSARLGGLAVRVEWPRAAPAPAPFRPDRGPRPGA